MKPGNKLEGYMRLVDKAGSASWNRIHFTVWTGLYWRGEGSRGHYPMGIDQIWEIRWRMRERMRIVFPAEDRRIPARNQSAFPERSDWKEQEMNGRLT